MVDERPGHPRGAVARAPELGAGHVHIQTLESGCGGEQRPERRFVHPGQRGQVSQRHTPHQIHTTQWAGRQTRHLNPVQRQHTQSVQVGQRVVGEAPVPEHQTPAELELVQLELDGSEELAAEIEGAAVEAQDERHGALELLGHHTDVVDVEDVPEVGGGGVVALNFVVHHAGDQWAGAALEQARIRLEDVLHAALCDICGVLKGDWRRRRWRHEGHGHDGDERGHGNGGDGCDGRSVHQGTALDRPGKVGGAGGDEGAHEDRSGRGTGGQSVIGVHHRRGQRHEDHRGGEVRGEGHAGVRGHGHGVELLAGRWGREIGGDSGPEKGHGQRQRQHGLVPHSGRGKGGHFFVFSLDDVEKKSGKNSVWKKSWRFLLVWLLGLKVQGGGRKKGAIIEKWEENSDSMRLLGCWGVDWGSSLWIVWSSESVEHDDY